MLVRCQLFGDLFLFGLVWQYSLIQKNIMKVGSKPRLLNCTSNITLSLPSLYFSESKRELNFCNGYLSLLYFCCKAYALGALPALAALHAIYLCKEQPFESYQIIGQRGPLFFFQLMSLIQNFGNCLMI